MIDRIKGSSGNYGIDVTKELNNYPTENVTILCLDEKLDKKPINSIREHISKEIYNNNIQSSVPRNLEVSNMLLPELTLFQNIKFFCELHDASSIIDRSDYNIYENFKDFLHFKREEIDEALWQTFGLILYLLMNKDYLFISMPLGTPLTSNKRSDLIFHLTETKKYEKIFFYAFPPAIDAYKNICKHYRILEKGSISDILSYDHARERIIDHNNNKS